MAQFSPKHSTLDLPPSEAASDCEVVPSKLRARASDTAGWLALQGRDSKASRDWATSLREPVESVLEDLRRRPARAAALFGPVMDAALVQVRRAKLEKFQQSFTEWVAIAVNPSLWKQALSALWEGETVWGYLEKTSAWYQVSEALLLDPNSKSVLGHVESPNVRHTEGQTALLHLMSIPYSRPDEPDQYAAQDDGDDSQVLVLVGVHCHLAVRVHGTPSEQLRPTLQKLCEEADGLFERATMDARTRTGMIERLLQRALMKTSPASSPWTWHSAKIAGSIAALALFAVLLNCAVHEHRWQKALTVLSSEPGIQIINETSSWGRREVAGFRDAKARDPKEVLTSAGIDPSAIILSFKPYFSAEAVFTAAQKWLPPTGHPVVKAKPLEEIKPSSPAPVAAAPIKEVAPPVKAAEPAPKPSQDQAQFNAIEALRFEFEAGSEFLTKDSKTALDEAAHRLVELQTNAELAKQALRISINVIHTAVPVRGAVWQLRHSAVHDVLKDGGIRPAAISPALIAPSAGSPPSLDSLDQMSLRLTLEPQTAIP